MAIFPAAVSAQADLWTAVNGISTVLSSAIDDLVTTIPVTDTTNFPSKGYFVIDTEIISYTGKTGTSFTGCTRGADGSTAAVHSSAAVAGAYVVADHHNIVTGEIAAIETLLGSNSQHLDLTGRAGFGIKFKSSGGQITILTFDDSNNPTYTPA